MGRNFKCKISDLRPLFEQYESTRFLHKADASARMFDFIERNSCLHVFVDTKHREFVVFRGNPIGFEKSPKNGFVGFVLTLGIGYFFPMARMGGS